MTDTLHTEGGGGAVDSGERGDMYQVINDSGMEGEEKSLPERGRKPRCQYRETVQTGKGTTQTVREQRNASRECSNAGNEEKKRTCVSVGDGLVGRSPTKRGDLQGKKEMSLGERGRSKKKSGKRETWDKGMQGRYWKFPL